MRPDITIQGSVSKGWLHKEGAYTFEETYYMDPLYRWKQDRDIDAFLQSRFPDYALYNMEANLVQASHFDSSHVLIGGIQPNLIVAALLGSQFVFYPDKDSDITNRPIHDVADIGDITSLPAPAETVEFPLIKEFERQIAFIKKEHPDLIPIPPFFWDTSGRATIHGFITTAQKLAGETVFIAMMDNAELMQQFHHWIGETYIALINHFSRIADLPITSVHIGECSGAMLSPPQFEEFIVPHAERLSEALGALRLHSCGNSDHLLGSMKKIDGLKIVDTGSGTSVARMRSLFGEKMEINIEPPLQLLMKGAPQSKIVEWLNRAVDENGDGPLKIAIHFDRGYSLDNCLAIFDELYKLNLVEPGRKF